MHTYDANGQPVSEPENEPESCPCCGNPLANFAHYSAELPYCGEVCLDADRRINYEMLRDYQTERASLFPDGVTFGAEESILADERARRAA